jgi:hypothetical protein
MNPGRSLFLLPLILFVAASAQAQGRRERLPPPRDPQFYQPRNKLEDFDGRFETLLIRGRHVVGTVRAQNGFARVEATEIRDSATGETASGAVITMIGSGVQPPANGVLSEEIRSLIDYDEIDALLKAMDAAAKASESITRLSHFEVRYRTRGDFEIIVFKQLENNVIAAAVEGGFFDRLRLYLSIDELVKLRWMIAQAKERLDEK